jgi:hypothetical protein
MINQQDICGATVVIIYESGENPASKKRRL